MPPMRRTNIGRPTRNARNINEFRRAHNPQARAAQTPPQIRKHVNIRRRSSDVSLNRAALEYDSAVAYKDLLCVDIGSLYIYVYYYLLSRPASETIYRLHVSRLVFFLSFTL